MVGFSLNAISNACSNVRLSASDCCCAEAVTPKAIKPKNKTNFLILFFD